MLTRLVRWQLTLFTLVALFSIVAVVLFYLKAPAALGIGTYQVSANFAQSGGLYKNANVSYRGTTIGKVTAIRLTHNNGVDADMQLNSDIAVPENVTASVRSMSAIGEQYIDLVAPSEPAASHLHDGSSIPRQRTTLPGDVAGLLHQAERLADSLKKSRLKDLLHETFQAFNGSGPELARLIESSRLLVEEADRHGNDITGLITSSEPVLDTQIASGQNIKTAAEGLARLSAELRNADPELRRILNTAPDAARTAQTTFDGIRPSFPVLAANLANLGRIGVIYHKSIEQVLVIFPPLTAALLAMAQQNPIDEGAKADFKFNLGDPPPCLTGFLPPSMVRSPADETLRDLPTDLYCKVPFNDPSNVRGARNFPCQEHPGKRAPTVALCRDPRGYIPVGNNPWRGPPVPVGTPITDPRMILPDNKYPYIPPQADYDPGPPVVSLPPGVPPGPGPAESAPYPKQGPPVTIGPPPPPLPFQAPQDQQVPPYGRTPATPPPVDPQPTTQPDPGELSPSEPAPPSAAAPAAAGASITTYDPASGQYLDPDGHIGIFANHGDTTSTAENWVDLMLDHRSLA
ncbi:MCE family protein [Mycolicibacterium fluoranthenivorans]|uniref:MCE family protein n=1 Tax=Mycolicibacterium fluoranthenivorans TaxID=258505 RepID=A0A7G8P6W5_9MYCO|nr:MCE family protein [Mycolicibacterium fluoranthenivorans]QNJ90081.1 MCE family protein [Mycolicibacterium fluoranthenivorans]